MHISGDSYLDTIEKIFFFCTTWVQMMPILVKGNDVRSETKDNARHGRHRSQSKIKKSFINKEN